ncbi:hypothetical protein VTO73DRAFT_8854 [Trametes versicolor]
MVFRDAVEGHQQALERGGLLQKDISNGGILIVEEPQQDLSSKGVLHDYDFDPMMLGKPEEVSKSASSEQSPLHSPELANVLRAAAIELATRRERMRTPHFLALDLLKPRVNGKPAPAPVHESHHCLESFFWVFLWIVLRCTDQQDGNGKMVYEYTFKDYFEKSAKMARIGWLCRTDDCENEAVLEIHNNRPLTGLLHYFHTLVCDSRPKRRFEGPRVPLNYSAVLHLFDSAIKQENWPRDDKALVFDGPDMRTTFKLSDFWRCPDSDDGESKKRPRDDDGDESDSDTESWEARRKRRRALGMIPAIKPPKFGWPGWKLGA